MPTATGVATNGRSRSSLATPLPRNARLRMSAEATPRTPSSATAKIVNANVRASACRKRGSVSTRA